MFCPKCRGEFYEGWTYCQKCNENLVESLPPIQEPESNYSKFVDKLKRFRIEDYLRYGGIVYIIVGIIADITSMIVHNLPIEINKYMILAGLAQLIFNIISTILWGLFFIGLGYIIQLLEDNLKNE